MTSPYRTGHFDTSGTGGQQQTTSNLRLTDITTNATVATPKVATPTVSTVKPHTPVIKSTNPAGVKYK